MAAVASTVESSVKDVKEAIVGTPSAYSEQTRARFEKFATHKNERGELAMNEEDFLNATTPPENAPNAGYHKIPRWSYVHLFKLANRRNERYLSFEDYAAMEAILNKAEADYMIAFRTFDEDGNGTVSRQEFVNVMTNNRSDGALPFDWDSPWVKLHLGDPKAGHEVTYSQFCQLVHGIVGERFRQAFIDFDKSKTGYITSQQFQVMVRKILGHKLSDHVLENLHTISNLTLGNRISYANIRAFQNIVNSMDIVEVIAKAACDRSPDHRITRDDFLTETARSVRWGSFTPMEADVLFHFASLDNKTGRLSIEDFQRVTDDTWRDPSQRQMTFDYKPLQSANTKLQIIANSLFNFGLGAIAGAFGATMVYPIDLVKTRMQNQRKGVIGQQLYNNSIDCFKKVLKNEGFRGLYSGITPQLLGVAPEKAIKLTVNDLIRALAQGTGPGGQGISFPMEMLAGGCAGGAQVVFTNPLEIVKIRLQVQGEVAKQSNGAPRRSALWIVQNLGILGLYKGASACLLRDVPFSAIYFPAYAHIKKDVFGEGKDGKQLGVLQTLISAGIAGMPAAYFTTPADVIKTRLQVEARSGETTYKGITDAFSKILKEEGPTAFFKGGVARVVRSSPQFGFTLAAYEFLKNVVPAPYSDKAAKAAASNQVQALDFIRSRSALKLLLDMDEKFGVPKYKRDIPQNIANAGKKFSGATA